MTTSELLLQNIDWTLRVIAFFYIAEWGFRAYAIVARKVVKDVFPR